MSNISHTSNRLRIPYVSQNGEGASYGIGDCGIACVTALARAFGRDVTVDDLGKLVNLPQGYRGAHILRHIRYAASRVGIKLAYRYRISAEELQEEINNRHSVIALVWYPHLKYKRLPYYYDGHFITVHGWRVKEDGLYFYYDDPEWHSAWQGEDIEISAIDLMKAMWQTGKHARTPGQCLVLRDRQLPLSTFWHAA